MLFAKLSALALFLASVAAQSITAPDQANWGTIISVKFDGIPTPNADLLLVGVNKKKTYLIAYQAQIYSGDINLVLPYVVEQGVKYQIVATNLNGGFGNPLTYALSNAFTIN